MRAGAGEGSSLPYPCGTPAPKGVAGVCPLALRARGLGGGGVRFFHQKGGGFPAHPLPINSRFGSRNINLYLCGR